MTDKITTKISLEDEVVLTTTRTLHNLFGYKNGSDAVGLYNFYMYTAKRQETNQVYATPAFCMKGLGWGKERFGNAQRVLKKESLIEITQNRGKDGKIEGWYIKVNYIWKKQKAKKVESILKKKAIPQKRTTIPQSQTVVSPECGNQTTNALSAKKVNALSAKKKNIYTLSEKPFFALALDFFSELRNTPEITVYINTDRDKLSHSKINPIVAVKATGKDVADMMEYVVDEGFSQFNPMAETLKDNIGQMRYLLKMFTNPKIGIDDTELMTRVLSKLKKEIEDGWGHGEKYSDELCTPQRLGYRFVALKRYNRGLRDNEEYQDWLIQTYPERYEEVDDEDLEEYASAE